MRFTKWFNLNLLGLKDKININKINENFNILDEAAHHIEDNAITKDSVVEKDSSYTERIAIDSYGDLYSKCPYKTYNVTIPTSAWSNNRARVYVGGVKPYDKMYSVSPDAASYLDYAESTIWADDITSYNYITFNCKKTPTTSIRVIVLESNEG